MGKIIALANQKGGVGKTTTAINLSACLAAAEKKTLLVDFDPQGNASIGLGLDKNSYSKSNIYHALVGVKEINECIYKTELPFLEICPADGNLVGAEVELVSAYARESKLKNILSQKIEDYDFIIIDCAPSLNLLTVNALNSADSYLVPMQTEYLSMEGLTQLLTTVKLIRSSLNPRLNLEGILLTMYDSRNNLSRLVANDLMEHFKNDIFKTIIPRNVKLSECPSFGKPIILYDITSKGSEAYLSLAKEIILKNQGIKKKDSIPTFNDYEINKGSEANL
jgi:chromosome partitioning protein